MARVIDESFEGAGYEESWTETVGGGCTLDEDSSGPGTLPPNGGSQCLRVSKGASNNPVYAIAGLGATQQVTYARVYLYIDSENLSNGQNYDHIFAIESAYPDGFIGVMLRKSSGGQLQLQPNYKSNSGWTNLTAVSVQVGQWYCLELYVNYTTDVVAWRLDGTQIDSVSDCDWYQYAWDPNRLMVGFRQAATNTAATLYYDLCVVDDADWVGAESSPAGTLTMLLIDPAHDILVTSPGW